MCGIFTSNIIYCIIQNINFRRGLLAHQVEISQSSPIKPLPSVPATLFKSNNCESSEDMQEQTEKDDKTNEVLQKDIRFVYIFVSSKYYNHGIIKNRSYTYVIFVN